MNVPLTPGRLQQGRRERLRLERGNRARLLVMLAPLKKEARGVKEAESENEAE